MSSNNNINSKTIFKLENEPSSIGNKIAKNPAFIANRGARLYWSNQIQDASSARMMPSARSLEQYTPSPSARLENPLVVGAISAGVLGVAIIAVIIIGVWIRSKLSTEDKQSSSRRRQINSSRERRAVESSTIMSSISTLDEQSNNGSGGCNETQMDSIRLDDTTLDMELDIVQNDLESELQNVSAPHNERNNDDQIVSNTV